MSTIVTRSIFNTTVAERNWKTQITSIVIHVIIIAGAFLITFPVAQQLASPAREHVTLVAPYVPRPQLKIDPPHIDRHVKLTPPVMPTPVKQAVVAKIIPPKILPPPVVPVVHTPLPEPRIEAEAKPLPAPKPASKPEAFPELQVAKATPVPKQVIVGGFGDPRGVQNSDKPKVQPVLMARVGSFDAPTGVGQSGGGGHLDSGSIKQAGFGSMGNANMSNTASNAGKVQTGNFGESGAGTARTNGSAVRASGFGDTTAAAAPRHDSPAAVAAFTPVEILSKPRPAYSAEARGLHLEGQVSLEVVFQASGAVKVIRILKGLGHGLDEAAQQAALQVRFKPATRSGAPVDTNATINITFELT